MKNWAGISAVLAAIALGVGWASLRTDADARPAGTGGGSTTTQCSITINGGTNTDALNANHVCDTSTPAASASPVPPSRVPVKPPAAAAKDSGAAPPNVPADIPIPTRPAGQSHPAPVAPSPTRPPSSSSTLSYRGGELEIALTGGGASKVATQSEADLQLYPAELAPLATLAARANPDNTCPALTGENTAGIGFDVQDRPLFCVKSRAGDHYRIRIEPDNTSTTRPFPYTISVVMVAAA